MPLVFFTFSRVPRLHSASRLDQQIPSVGESTPSVDASTPSVGARRADRHDAADAERAGGNGRARARGGEEAGRGEGDERGGLRLDQPAANVL
eukprot:7559183-Pyramimonas_sp.AAC.3